MSYDACLILAFINLVMHANRKRVYSISNGSHEPHQNRSAEIMFILGVRDS